MWGLDEGMASFSGVMSDLIGPAPFLLTLEITVKKPIPAKKVKETYSIPSTHIAEYIRRWKDSPNGGSYGYIGVMVAAKRNDGTILVSWSKVVNPNRGIKVRDKVLRVSFNGKVYDLNLPYIINDLPDGNKLCVEVVGDRFIKATGVNFAMNRVNAVLAGGPVTERPIPWAIQEDLAIFQKRATRFFKSDRILIV